MAIDPRAPVIVGLGELVRRSGEGGPTEPAALMAEAVRAAMADAGAGEDLLKRCGAVAAVPSVAWPDADPGRRVAERLRLDVTTLRSSMQGGNGPQLLVNEVARRIGAGELDAAVVCGAEALSTVARSMKEGEAPVWPAAGGERESAEALEADHAAGTETEFSLGLIAPIVAYPLIENAIRAASGRSVDEHLDLIAALWSRFSETAARHPCAWTPHRHTPEELRTPSPGNRQVTFPYTKLLNANIQVDQAAALALCSVQTARAVGVPADRWVFPEAGARATDEWFLSERPNLHRSPAIRACGEAVFDHAGARADELGPVDLYSCFPSAVELAALELGLPLDDPARPLTVTGGLTFFGGPGNNYAAHGIVGVARALREAAPGARGLATALGWYATKHAIGLYSNRPPSRPFAALEPPVDGGAAVEVAPPTDAEATAETCTIVYERDGSPSHGILFARLADGRRALAGTRDPDLMARMTGDEFIGSAVRVRDDRSFASH